MATVVQFDTLQVSKRLRQLGYTQEQAEGQAEILKETTELIQNENMRHLSTKEDLEKVKVDLLKWMFAMLTPLYLGVIGVLITIIFKK